MRGLQVFVLVALQKLRGTGGGGRLIWRRVRGQPEVVAEMSNNINAGWGKILFKSNLVTGPL